MGDKLMGDKLRLASVCGNEIRRRRLELAHAARECRRSRGEMSMPRIRMIAVVVALAALATPAAAQTWPTRPVTMVYPFAPGGLGDVLGRLLAPGLSEFL